MKKTFLSISLFHTDMMGVNTCITSHDFTKYLNFNCFCLWYMLFFHQWYSLLKLWISLRNLPDCPIHIKWDLFYFSIQRGHFGQDCAYGKIQHNRALRI